MDDKTMFTCAEHLAMATVPKQEWCEPYDWCTALAEGTIFPCLNLTFHKAPIGKCKCKTSNSMSDLAQKNREELMSELAAVSFALNDLTLYLDTHPDCPNGAPLFRKLLEERLSLLAEFTRRFYPLTETAIATGDYNKEMYGWPDGPLPWEGACI